MKKTFVLIIFALTVLSSCSKSQKDQVDNKSYALSITFPGDYKIYDTSGPSKGRIYLIHGFGGDKSTYDNYPFKTWVNDLSANGFQIVTFSLPAWKFEYYSSDGGLQYRKKYIEFVRGLVSKIDQDYGVAVKNIAGGISFGGLHSMMTVELMPDLFDSYFASVPVTDYTALEELSAGDSTYFNVFENPEQLSKKPGFIQWGELDERVNFRLTVKLISLIDQYPNQLTRTDLGQIGHVSTPSNLNNLTQWLLAQ